MGCRPRAGPIQPLEERIDDGRVEEFVRERRYFGPIAEQGESRHSGCRSVQIAVGRVVEASVDSLPPSYAGGQVRLRARRGGGCRRAKDPDRRRRPVEIRAVGALRRARTHRRGVIAATRASRAVRNWVKSYVATGILLSSDDRSWPTVLTLVESGGTRGFAPPDTDLLFDSIRRLRMMCLVALPESTRRSDGHQPSSWPVRCARRGAHDKLKWTGWLLFLPFAVVFAATVILPLGYAVGLSLFRSQFIGGVQFAGLANYVDGAHRPGALCRPRSRDPVHADSDPGDPGAGPRRVDGAGQRSTRVRRASSGWESSSRTRFPPSWPR